MLSPCGIACSSLYRAGQDLSVFYDPENLGYAQLHPANRSGYVWVVFLGLMGVIFLTGAVANMVPQLRQIIGPAPD